MSKKTMNKNMERMQALIEEKKKKPGYLQAEKKIGSGRVEKVNKNKGNGPAKTKLKDVGL
jgi:hypothetical protein